MPLVGGALLAVAAAIALVAPAADPALAPLVPAELHLVRDRVASSGGGVFVLPVELRGAAPGASVDEIAVWAAPVLAAPAGSGSRQADGAGTARFVALLQPDCALLRGPAGVGSGAGDIDLVATVSVQLSAVGHRRTQVVLDLAGDRAVAARVQRLCAWPVAAPAS